MHIKPNGDLINIGINLGTETKFNMYLDMIFMKKDILITLVKESIEKGDATLINQAILSNRDRYKISTYNYDGYMENIVDVQSYYEANLRLLESETYNNLFNINGKVKTKTKDEPPTIYNEHPNVTESLIANGCIVEGEVENSVVFRGVKIGKNVTIKNSIIMQKSVIEDDAIVINTILDKATKVEAEAHVVGSYSQPYVLGKGKVVRKD